MAKLDFLLRYPPYFARALAARRRTREVENAITEAQNEGATIESRMVRYRYGPWDPAYFGLLGRLIGKGLIEPLEIDRGIGYRVTERGRQVSDLLAKNDLWSPTARRVDLLKKHLDLTGTGLKHFIYREFPEVASADWGTVL